MYNSERIAFLFCCYSNKNFWLTKKYYLLTALFYKFILHNIRSQDRDGWLTRCPLEHLKHLVIIYSAIAVFVATRVCGRIQL